MLWLCLLAALVGGVFFGGRQSIALVRQGDFAGADRALLRSGLVAAACGVLAASLTLGWPWKRESVSVPEEVTRTVVRTVQVPVRVTRWLFFSREETKSVEVADRVTETIWQAREQVRFSPFL